MGQFWGDLRIAWRSLGKARGFAVAVVATLSLAIALATAVLAVVNAYLLRALPYPGASRLYGVSYAPAGQAPPRGLAELPWDALSDVVEHPISWDLDMFYLVGGDHPEAAPGAWVTPGFMQGLGIQPAIGRSFTAEEFKPGSPQVALVSHALWRRRFGGDPGVIGRRFGAYVSDRPSDPDLFTVVGVLPANFWHLNPYTEILTPLRASSYPYLVSLREGVSPGLAEQRITDLVHQGQDPRSARPRVELHSVHVQYTRTLRPTLLAIGAAVCLVLLIAGANVSFLALIRGARRQREVAVRLALGAGMIQVARSLVAEALLLAGAAAVAGTALALLLIRLLAPGVQLQLGRPIPGGPAALSIDGTVAGAVVGLTLLLAGALTLAPLLVSRGSVFSMLRRGKGGSHGSHGRRSRAALITVEVAGSLALLVACGLMVRTVVGLLQVDLGIQADRVISTTLGLRERSYPGAEPRIAFYERLVAGLGQTPGVAGAALSAPSPLTEFEPTPVQAEDPGSPASTSGIRWITQGYFSVLAIPLSQGRDFTSRDRAGSEPVAILSETAARRLWPGKPALGKRLRVVERQITAWDTVTVTRTVVGVVRDVRHSPTDAEPAEVYVPLLQAPGRFAAIVLRAGGPPANWLTRIRAVLRGLDPEIPVGPVRPLPVVVGEQLARPRFLAGLFAGFGGFATLLALIGVYGVIAYAVKQREHEVAVRMAVGADGSAIRRLFLREGTVLLLVGVAAGVPGALAIGRLLRAQLYGVAAVDPLTLVGASLGLGAAGLVAVWWPCRRASRIDPVTALKEE